MLALSLPEIPNKLQAAFFAAGAVVILLAAMRTTTLWERLFADGVGAFGIWVAYFAATRGGIVTTRAHAVVFLLLMTVALGLFIACWITAGTLPGRLAAAGLTVFIARAWWEAMRGAFCGPYVHGSCPSWVVSVSIPAWLAVAMVAAAIVLLVQAAVRLGAEASLSRWILFGLAFYLLSDLDLTFRFATDSLPFGRASSLVSLIGFGGALVMGVLAARERMRAAAMTFGAGLAVFVVPDVWNALRGLTIS